MREQTIENSRKITMDGVATAKKLWYILTGDDIHPREIQYHGIASDLFKSIVKNCNLSNIYRGIQNEQRLSKEYWEKNNN